jgi:hypothetical protein
VARLWLLHFAQSNGQGGSVGWRVVPGAPRRRSHPWHSPEGFVGLPVR